MNDVAWNDEKCVWLAGNFAFNDNFLLNYGMKISFRIFKFRGQAEIETYWKCGNDPSFRKWKIKMSFGHNHRNIVNINGDKGQRVRSAIIHNDRCRMAAQKGQFNRFDKRMKHLYFFAFHSTTQNEDVSFDCAIETTTQEKDSTSSIATHSKW